MPLFTQRTVAVTANDDDAIWLPMPRPPPALRNATEDDVSLANIVTEFTRKEFSSQLQQLNGLKAFGDLVSLYVAAADEDESFLKSCGKYVHRFDIRMLRFRRHRSLRRLPDLQETLG